MLVERDLFQFWRFLLATLCTVYTGVILFRSLSGWIAYLSGADRGSRLMRSYVVLHAARIRIRRFAPDLLTISAYLVILAWLLALHRQV